MRVGRKFGAEMDFGAQMGPWRAQVGAGDRLGAHMRPHAATRGADSPNHVGSDRQLPTRADQGHAPEMSEQLPGTRKACVRLAASMMLCVWC